MVQNYDNISDSWCWKIPPNPPLQRGELSLLSLNGGSGDQAIFQSKLVKGEEPALPVLKKKPPLPLY